MDRLRHWLSENIAERELSIIGRQVLQIIRRDNVTQFPKMIMDKVTSSNSSSGTWEGFSNQPLNTEISKEICERNDLTGREPPRKQNERMEMSSADEGSLEEDEPSEGDDLLQLNIEKHDCTRIQSTVKSNEILNGSGKSLTHSSEVGDHTDRAFECSAEKLVPSGVVSLTHLSEVSDHADKAFDCSAEKLVLSGIVSPEELQDVNNIIAEPEIFFCDMEELTNSSELGGKNIEPKQDQYVPEGLETNCMPLQVTTDNPFSKTIHLLNDDSVSFVYDFFSNNRAVIDTSSFNDETRIDLKDLTSEAEKVSFTEGRNISDPSPSSSFCSTTELLGDNSDKEVASSETCQSNDHEGIVQDIVSAENGSKCSNTQHLDVSNESEGLNVSENKNQVNSLTEGCQGCSLFEDSHITRNQHRSVKHFLQNGTAVHQLHQSENSKIKSKKFKVAMKQLNIRDMFMKRAEESDKFATPQNRPIIKSCKKMRSCVSEANRKPVLPKRNSTASDAKLKYDIVKNSSRFSKNNTLESIIHMKKHKKNSSKIHQGLKSSPFLEVKHIEKTRKEVIGSESVYLDDITASELEERLCRAEPLEIGMTLVYRGGFCDLNKPAASTVLSVHEAVGVLLSIKVSQSEVPNFYYISFDENDWKEIATPKHLLKTVLNHSCRKICFCAQDFMMDLIKRFQFSRSEVCLKWILLDPLIGCWLLNPDKSFYFFSEVAAALGLKESSTFKDGPNQTKLSSLPQALEKLSLSAMLLYQKLEKAGLWRLFLDIEMKLVSILSVMETRGICTNTKKLREMQNILHEHLDNLQEQAYKEAGKQFLINSPQQLRNILYEELQLDQRSNTKVRETAKRGQKSTSEHMLSLLRPWHPLPGTVMQYRHLQKIKSTFIDGVLQQVVEGKVFPSWGQHCAATGRITSSNPNLQAIPKQPVVLKILRDEEYSSDKILLLRSPYHTRDGYTLVSADFQHIELRMLAHLSKDPLLKEILQKSDDVFTSMSRIWLGKTQGMIETEDREKTKRIMYAVMYGAGPAKLSEFLNINHSEASSIINSFLAHFPAIKKFSNTIVKECQRNECLHTISGRHRLFPNIISGNSGLKSYTERQAVNFLMQGSAADICKCAMIHTELEFLKHPELDVHLLIQIHDELVWEVKDEHFDIVKDIIRKSMEDCSNISEFQIQISVPLPVIMKKGKDWANMQEM